MMQGCISTRGSGSPQGLCVCRSTGLLGARSQPHRPPVFPNLCHSLHHPHPWCHWVNSQVPTYGALPPCSSPSSAHWLLKATLAQSWCWECWWSRCRLTLRFRGSAQLSDSGSPSICLSPRRPQLHIGCSTKDLFMCLEWSFEVNPGFRAILYGQMHL